MPVPLTDFIVKISDYRQYKNKAFRQAFYLKNKSFNLTDSLNQFDRFLISRSHSGTFLNDSGSFRNHSGSSLNGSGSSLNDSGSSLNDCGSSLNHSGSFLNDSGNFLNDSEKHFQTKFNAARLGIRIIPQKVKT